MKLNLTDGQVEMVLTALRAKVEFWRTCGLVMEDVQREQLASWRNLLSNIERQYNGSPTAEESVIALKRLMEHL